jgi:Family of unknown function (DUF6228)
VQAEIRDTVHPHRAVFTWWLLENPRETPYVEVALEYRDVFRVTATLGTRNTIAEPLLRFLDDIGSLSNDWEGPRTFLSEDEDLGITCFWCRRGEIFLEFSLDADPIDPFWTVKLRLSVERTAWPAIIQQFRDFFAAAEGQD